MASLSLPRTRCWHNLQSPCQAPTDPRCRRGVVCQLAWSFRCFPRRMHREVPRASWLLVRPHLLTASQPAPWPVKPRGDRASGPLWLMPFRGSSRHALVHARLQRLAEECLSPCISP